MARIKEVESALPNLSLVFGYIAVKELQSATDRVEILGRLGYGNQEIAIITGKTPDVVKVLKSQLKKNRKRGK